MRTCGAKHEGKDTAEKTLSVGHINVMDDFLSKIDAVVNNGDFAFAQEIITKFCAIPQVYLKYYHISLDFENMKKNDKDNSYIKFKDIKNKHLKENIKKISDIEGLNDNTDVVIPQYGSPLMNKVLNSPEYIKVINDNLDNIKRGEYKNKFLPIAFSTSRDLRLTLGHALLYNLHYEKDVLCGTLWDGYNYELKKLELLKRINETKSYKVLPSIGKELIYKLINNNAVAQQKKGHLKNFIILMPIIMFENMDI